MISDADYFYQHNGGDEARRRDDLVYTAAAVIDKAIIEPSFRFAHAVKAAQALHADGLLKAPKATP